MCNHVDHKVVTLPDGQVDETHVFSDAELVRITAAVNRMAWRMRVLGYPIVPVAEVS